MAIEQFQELLIPMLGLLAIGVVWLVVRGLLRLVTRTVALGCGLLLGVGLALVLGSLLAGGG